MRIAQITVSYGQTQSLPEYSNVKVQVSLNAELEPSDDEAAVEAAYRAEQQAIKERASAAHLANRAVFDRAVRAIVGKQP